MTARMNRRIYGLLGKRLDEARFDEVRDDRKERGKRWELGALLRAVTGAMLGGAKSLAEVESLSERMSTPFKKLLGVERRVPDTTLRDALTSVEPDEVRRRLHALCKAAQRRKALEPDDLPFGVVSLDGKGFSIPAADDWYAQRQTGCEDGPLIGVVRTQRSDERRNVPWKQLLSDVFFALIATTKEHLVGLRRPAPLLLR